MLGGHIYYAPKTNPIFSIAQLGGVEYEYDEEDCATAASSDHVNDWLIHHMDQSPLTKLCYSADINGARINDFLDKYGTESASQLDANHEMTPLDMLCMNPFASADLIAADLFHVNMEAAFRQDNQFNTALDYARRYNLPAMLKMIEALCMNSLSLPLSAREH